MQCFQTIRLMRKAQRSACSAALGASAHMNRFVEGIRRLKSLLLRLQHLLTEALPAAWPEFPEDRRIKSSAPACTMKVSTKTRYALRLMLDLAQNQGDYDWISLKDIAERQGVSKKYLEQIVAALHRERLLLTARGNQGGYGQE